MHPMVKPFSRNRLAPRSAIFPALAVLWLFTPTSTAAQNDLRLEDRVLAVVNEDPVFDSDVERAIALGVVAQETDAEGQPTETDEVFRRRVLERVIEQRLRFHAVESFGFELLPEEEVEAEVAKLQARFGGPEEFQARLKSVGLTDASLRQLLARQLKVLTYIEERLGPRIFVRREEVQTYYQDVLVPELTAAGSEVPPLDEVRESIRQVLREQRLNEEIEKWTRDLRAQADVQLFLEPPASLPPAVSSRS